MAQRPMFSELNISPLKRASGERSIAGEKPTSHYQSAYRRVHRRFDTRPDAWLPRSALDLLAKNQRHIEPCDTGWAKGKSSIPDRKSTVTQVASSGDLNLCSSFIAVFLLTNTLDVATSLLCSGFPAVSREACSIASYRLPSDVNRAELR
jgi:hypothetical protein